MSRLPTYHYHGSSASNSPNSREQQSQYPGPYPYGQYPPAYPTHQPNHPHSHPGAPMPYPAPYPPALAGHPMYSHQDLPGHLADPHRQFPSGYPPPSQPYPSRHGRPTNFNPEFQTYSGEDQQNLRSAEKSQSAEDIDGPGGALGRHPSDDSLTASDTPEAKPLAKGDKAQGGKADVKSANPAQETNKEADGDASDEKAAFGETTTATSGTSTGVPDFVRKLFRMLEDSTETDIVTWGVKGDTFVIKDPNEFAKAVLPKHFKHNNPASFVRQLNKYGFHKIKSQDDGRLYGDSAWEFQHPNFQYNKREMLDSIRRKTLIKGKSTTNAACPTTVATVDNLANEFRRDTTDLQSQVNSLAKVQGDIAAYLESLSRNYMMIVEEVLSFRKNMIAQDQVIRNLVGYIADNQRPDTDRSKLMNFSRPELPTSSMAAALPGIGGFPSLPAPSVDAGGPGNVSSGSSNDALQEFNKTYQAVARASFHQMDEISRHVKEAYGSVQNPPGSVEETVGSAPSTSAGAPAGSINDSIRDTAAVSAALNEHFGELQDQNGGLTVFTVGGLTPRREEPVGPSNGNAGQCKSVRVTRATFVPPWSVPPKVLLVEDDSTCRRLSSKLLQIFGCAFDVAVDGLDAVERMGIGNKYDIVLMDIVMPNLNGVAATNRIRQFDRTTPIISMTSNTTANDCLTYFANGMNDVLPKPFNKDSMLSMIERYCNHLVGQQAAAMGIPKAICASDGFRPNDWERGSGRIFEMENQDGYPSSSGNGSHAQTSHVGTSCASAPPAADATTADYSNLLNLPFAEMPELGAGGFGTLGDNPFMNTLERDTFATAGGQRASQPQHPQHPQRQPQQQQFSLSPSPDVDNTPSPQVVAELGMGAFASSGIYGHPSGGAPTNLSRESVANKRSYDGAGQQDQHNLHPQSADNENPYTRSFKRARGT